MKHKRSVMSIAMAAIMLLSLCTVVSTTSVMATNGNSNTNVGSAAGGITPPDQIQTNLAGAPMAAESKDNARASGQATPDLVGSPIAAGTGPAACIMNRTTDMYVFVQGYDGALWYRIWNMTSFAWTGSWVSLGGKLSSSPCAVSREAGVIDAYVAGTDGAVYERSGSYYGGTWHDWYKVGGKVAPGTGPAACGLAGREDVFVQGTDGALYQTTWTAASPTFSNWVNRGGKLTSSPAAVYRPEGWVEVGVRGTNGHLYGFEYNIPGDYWSWYDLGGVIAGGTGPGVCAYGSTSDSTSRFDFFVAGTNGALYQRTWTITSGWSPNWTNLGGVLSASPTAATYTYTNALDIIVFVRGTNGNIYYKEFYEGAWHSWQPGISGPP